MYFNLITDDIAVLVMFVMWRSGRVVLVLLGPLLLVRGRRFELQLPAPARPTRLPARVVAARRDAHRQLRHGDGALGSVGSRPADYISDEGRSH